MEKENEIELANSIIRKPDKLFSQHFNKIKEIQEKIQVKKDFISEKLINGPVGDDERRCTDLFFFYIWLGATIFSVYLTVNAWVYGHPDRMIIPFDANKRACGFHEEVKDYPYIYFVVPLQDYLNRSICVKTCPHMNNDVIPQRFDCIPNQLVPDCEYHYPIGGYTGWNPNNLRLQTKYNLSSMSLFYNSIPHWGRLCLPEDPNYKRAMQKDVRTIFDQDDLSRYLSDVQFSWPIILITSFIAYGISVLYVIIFKFSPELMIWLGIAIYFVSLTLVSILILNTGQTMHDDGDSAQYWAQRKLYHDADTLRLTSYTLFGCLALSVVGIICLWKRISRALSVIKSAIDFVSRVRSIFLQPMIAGLIVLMFWSYMIVVSIYIYSSGQIIWNPWSPFETIYYDAYRTFNLVIFLIVVIWTNSFFLGFTQFIVASSCSLWYFSDKEYGAHRPITRSLYRIFRFHLGSLALSSLILSFVQLIRLPLYYIERCLGQSNQKAALQHTTNCCSKCITNTFYQCFGFLTKNAIIYQALTGKSLLTSARHSYRLVIKNRNKFFELSGIGQIFSFVGKVYTAILSGFLCFIIIGYADPYKSNVFSPVLPAIICLMIGYIQGNIFSSIYSKLNKQLHIIGMALDTIIICSILDLEIMRRANMPAYFQNDTIKKYLDKIQQEDEYEDEEEEDEHDIEDEINHLDKMRYGNDRL